MERIFHSMEELIGSTPLLELKRIEEKEGLNVRLLAKLERCNPAGSSKDRVAKAILDDAEKCGRLTKDTVIIEPTSGNTGIGLAALAACRGLRAIIVMPDTMSVERRLLITAYGAELVLSDGSRGMAGAIEKAEELAASLPNSLIAGQFVNPANPAAHYETTGPEIWRDTDGKLDIFVAGVGTGGTLSGTGKYLKEQKSGIEIIGVEPAGSNVLSGGAPGAHGLQGIGAGFIPKNLDMNVLDEVITVTEKEAYSAGRDLARYEGLLCGITSGAALHAAIKEAKRTENAGKTIVVLLPDTGERYLSTPMFAEE